MARQAMLLVADEIYYNLQGKITLQGIYHSELNIPADPVSASQLIFLFTVETDISDPFRSLAVEITLPGSGPVRNQVLVVYPVPPSLIRQGSTKFFYRHPLLISSPILHY